MRSFFHGWKRKTGLVMLCMACLITMAWVRSLYTDDIIDLSELITHDNYTVPYSGIMSFEGNFHILKQHVTTEQEIVMTSTKVASTPSIVESTPDEVDQSDSSVVPAVAQTPVTRTAISVAIEPMISIPYWPIVATLTLVAAWCLLTKSKSPSRSQSDSEAA